VAILRVSKSPSNHWLIGATLAGYLLIAFILRFWGEGLLLPANDIGYLNGPPQESHVGLIVLTLVGVFVTVLGVLQSLYSVQGSEKITRVSLWLNFLAIFSFGIAGFGTKYTVLPLHFVVLLVSVLAFPTGLILSLANILWGWLRRNGLPNVESRG
jgi:hypothetical protein